ncbi:MAG: hypothetical protein AABY15_06850 [Nanoarchaeota archaeon]
MNFKIKITGGGTPQEIADALEQVVNNLRDSIETGSTKELDGCEWEDPILMTEISEDENSEE